jgi:hypothetical protein
MVDLVRLQQSLALQFIMRVEAELAAFQLRPVELE